MIEMETGIYRMSSSRFALELFRRYAPWWLWTGVAAAFLGIMAGAFYDVRWTIVGFMVLLIMLPQALAVCYYSHALCRECFVNVLPHSVSVGESGLVVTLYEKQEQEGEASDAESTEYRMLRHEVFGPGCVRGWYIREGAGFVELEDKRRGFLWVPLDSDGFDSVATFAHVASSENKPERISD